MQQDAQEAGTDWRWDPPTPGAALAVSSILPYRVHLNPCFEEDHVQKLNQNALGQVCLVSTTKELSLLVVTSYIWKMVDKELLLSGI